MNNLRVARKEKGYTLKKLGEKIGVAESTVSLYENGKREPDYNTLLKLSDILGVSVDYLLGREQGVDGNTLGNRIRQLRIRSEIDQQTLANRLNISNSALSQYESGVRVPSDDVKIAIASYFNVSVDYLLGVSDVKNTADAKDDDISVMVREMEERPAIRVLFDKARGASDEDVERAIAIIDALRKQSEGGGAD